MKNKWLICVLLSTSLIFGLSSSADASTPKVYWDGLLMVEGQVGKIKVIKPINLWKREGNKLVFTRVLKPGEQYRVYRYDNLHGGQYGLGGGYYITKMDGYVDYRTPSKKKLAELAAAYGKDVSIPAPKLSIGTVTSHEYNQIAPGVIQSDISVDSNRGKQKIYTVEYDGKTTNIDLEVSLANNQLYGFETVSKQANRNQANDYHVVAGVNGDYFDSNGHPIDLMMLKGEIVTTRQTALNEFIAFGITSEGKPLIGNPNVKMTVKVNGQSSYNINSVNRKRLADHLVIYTPYFASSTRTNGLGTEVVVKVDSGSLNGHSVLTGTVTKVIENVGDEPLKEGEIILSGHHLASVFLNSIYVGDRIEITTEFSSSEWNAVEEVISGRYHLVANGEVIPQSVAGVHPRTAVGIKADNSIVTVVVDGRKSNHSVGVTLSELALIMKDLGAVHAFTFDGGGSSTLVTRELGDVNATVSNQPSDGIARGVANSLLFVSRWLTSSLNDIIVSPKEITLFAGATYQDLGMKIKGIDRYFNPVAITQQPIFSSSLLKKNADGSYTTTSQVTNGELSVTVGSFKETAKLMLTNILDKVELTEKEIVVERGNSYKISPKGMYKGEAIVTDPTIFTWNVTPEIGTINKNGEFVATTDGVGVITVSYGGLSSTINITVGLPETMTLENFEGDLSNYQASGARYNYVDFQRDSLNSKVGSYAARLTYDFTGTTGTSGAYIIANNPIPLTGHPKKIGMWVYGDGSGHWLRMQLTDGQNKEVQLDFTNYLDWTGWKYVEANIPTGIQLPLLITMPIRYMEVNDTNKNSGTIYIDEIQAIYK